jgi:cytochrome c551/c552
MGKMTGFLSALFLATLVAAPFAHADAKKGEALFNDKGATKCLVCHAVGKKLVGPDLAGVSKRHSKAWMVKWLAKPQDAWSSNDPETVQLKKSVHKETAPKTGHMPPPLTDEQASDIADFLMTK